MSCLFCEIVAGGIPSKTAFQDESIVAFHDVNPQAPTHILVIPRRHIAAVTDLTPADDALVGSLVRTATDIAVKLGHHERGFRLVFNCGEDAGYSVYHVHLHLVAGRKLKWPPG